MLHMIVIMFGFQRF